MKTKLIVTLMLAGSMATGCATSPSTRFYRLAPMAEGSVSKTEKKKNTGLIVIGPTTLAGYLDQPKIAETSGDYEIRYNEFNRWTDKLGNLIPKTIAENLRVLLNSNNIVVYPTSRNSSYDSQILLEILRFENSTSAGAVLEARWSVTNPTGAVLVDPKHFYYSSAKQARDFENTAHALSEGLYKLSQKISESIK